MHRSETFRPPTRAKEVEGAGDEAGAHQGQHAPRQPPPLRVLGHRPQRPRAQGALSEDGRVGNGQQWGADGFGDALTHKLIAISPVYVARFTAILFDAHSKYRGNLQNIKIKSEKNNLDISATMVNWKHGTLPQKPGNWKPFQFGEGFHIGMFWASIPNVRDHSPVQESNIVSVKASHLHCHWLHKKNHMRSIPTPTPPGPGTG